MAVSVSASSGVRFEPAISSVYYYTGVRGIPDFRDMVVLYWSLGYMLE